MDNVFIVIVTFNAMPWIESCLKSTGAFPVIIVDNSSSDETITYIKENFPTSILLPQEKNLGFGRANNIGIAHALRLGAEWVFLLNQDAYLLDNCLENLIHLQKRNPQYGILSPIHINSERNKIDYNFFKHTSVEYNPFFFADHILKKDLKNIYEFPYINAAAWLISKKCLETIGGFDPLFFHYGEDLNYCSRARFHGLKIGVCPEEYIVHDREMRQKKAVKPFTRDFLNVREINLKVRLADINIDSKQIYKESLSEVKKSIIKNLVFLKIKNLKFHRRELKMILNIWPDTRKSYEKNKKKGMHYIP